MTVRPRSLFAAATFAGGALALALAPLPAALAGAQKQSSVSIRFHAEGGSEGGSFAQKVELINPKRMTTMQSMPLVTERDVKSFFPYQAQDGSGTWGAAFRLDAHGTSMLAQHTMSRRGTYLLAYFNGRHVIDIYVDRGVNDGIISIPTGLTPNDIALLDAAFPHLGHENEKPAGKKPKREKPPAKATPPPPLKASDMPRMQPAMTRDPSGAVVPAKAYPGGPATGAALDGPLEPRPLSPIGQ